MAVTERGYGCALMRPRRRAIADKTKVGRRAEGGSLGFHKLVSQGQG